MSDLAKNKSVRFSCDECNESFEYKNSLLIHKKTHSEDKPHTCDVCQESFREEYALNFHRSTHEGLPLKPFVCPTCGKSFKEKQYLNLHYRIHDVDKHLSCDVCGKVFKFAWKLRDHVDSHNVDRPFECKICSKRFLTEAYFEAHTRTHSDDALFSCHVCEKKFSTKSGYKKHFNSKCSYEDPDGLSIFARELVKYPHTKNPDGTYTCDICMATFPTDVLFERHAMVHTGERRYQCGICFIGFKTLPVLRYHFEIHSSKKSYSCKECFQVFRTYKSFHSHKSMHKLRNKLKTKYSGVSHKCKYCSASFRYKAVLQTHLLSHPAEKYICSTCPEEFSDLQSFEEHTRTHEHTEHECGDGHEGPTIKQEPAGSSNTNCYSILYSCMVCSQKFMDNFAFKKHLLSHKSGDHQSKKKTKNVCVITVHPQVDSKPVTSTSKDASLSPEREPKVKTSTHKCNVCLIQFKTKKALSRHQYSHLNMKDYVCSICSTAFRNPQKFRLHSLSHKTLFKCDRCSESFNHEGALLSHYYAHLHTTPFVCNICKQSFPTELKLEKHSAIHE